LAAWLSTKWLAARRGTKRLAAWLSTKRLAAWLRLTGKCLVTALSECLVTRLGKCLIGLERIVAILGSPQSVGDFFHILFSQRTHRVFPDNLDC
jgi:hypothetical protein